MKRVLLLLTLSLAGIMLSSCMDSSSADEQTFREVNSGDNIENAIFTTKQSKVITRQNDYNAELAIYTSDIPETIDFTMQKVLLVDMGMRSSGGHAIYVTSVEVSENFVTANVTLVTPGNCPANAVLTNPYQFVVIPTQKEILISETLEIRNCF